MARGLPLHGTRLGRRVQTPAQPAASFPGRPAASRAPDRPLSKNRTNTEKEVKGLFPDLLPVEMTETQRKAALEHPRAGTRTAPVPVVLDTDAKNEIDDQFAIAYTLLSPALHCEAIYAAPFAKREYPSAAAGMEASYVEIQNVLSKMPGIEPPPVWRGSTAFLTETGRPCESAAALDLIERAAACRARGARLYVVAIGALTNVASALLLRPEIARDITVLWLGGQPEYWPHTDEFNLSGDVAASQVVLDIGVPLVRFPCKNVAEHVRSVPAEIRKYVEPCGELGAYLARIFCDFIPGRVRSKVIWDIVPVAWLNNPAWVPTEVRPTPRLRADRSWDLSDLARPPYRVAVDAYRDPILLDLVEKLEKFAGREADQEEGSR